MMYRVFFLIVILSSSILLGRNSRSLINERYIREFLTYEAPFHDSHGAQKSYLGLGMLYYTLTYLSKAKTCVCLGSGGGFVPRMMRQAQRDLGLSNARTYLIDGNMGEWGRPAWMNKDSFFRKQFPDIAIIIDTTAHVANRWDRAEKIEYLHIDADHSFEGVVEDFENYIPLMAPNGIISIHDTCGDLPCAMIVDLLKQRGYELINLKEYGAGVAIIHL